LAVPSRFSASALITISRRIAATIPTTRNGSTSTDGERHGHRRVDEELAVAEQRRDPGPVAAPLVGGRASHEPGR